MGALCPDPVKRAIQDFTMTSASSHRKNRVLVLGAGLVARPLVRYLLEQARFPVTVASRTVSKAEALVNGHQRGTARALDIRQVDELEALVSAHDLTVSLLPAPLHPTVGRLCLKHGKHMATTSYMSPEMRQLGPEASRKELVFLNECGVDPGIDHMTAMRIFHDIRDRGGRIVSFKSYCGGLPAPDANDNPLGYKFSWAPRGVLVAAGSSARYLLDGRVIQVPGRDLLGHVHMLDMNGVGPFEAYPNRDSMSYIETYGLHDVTTMFRGTLRYPGHCERWKAWVELGLFDDTVMDFPERTLRGVLAALMSGAHDSRMPREVAARLRLEPSADPVETLGWLGFYSDEALDEDVHSPLDALAQAMLARMRYRPGESDMIVMHHEVLSQFSGHREETTMNLVDYGIPYGDSSMARTVSLPVAIGVRLILEGQVNEYGVIAPVSEPIYTPILDELDTLGIHCQEQTREKPL